MAISQEAKDWIKRDEIYSLLKNSDIPKLLLEMGHIPTSLRSQVLAIFDDCGINLLKKTSTITYNLFAGMTSFIEEYRHYPMYFEEFVIPDNIKLIDRKAFYNNKFYTSIIVGKNVQDVSRDAFFYSNIETLAILSESAKITLENMNHLKELILDPKQVVSIGFMPKLNRWFVHAPYEEKSANLIRDAYEEGLLPSLNYIEWEDKVLIVN